MDLYKVLTVIELTRRVRTAQKEYCKNSNRSNLIQAKKLESELDKMLMELDER